MNDPALRCEPISREAPADDGFIPNLQTGDPLREAITSACRMPEPLAVQQLLEQARLAPSMARRTRALAQELAQTLRDRRMAPGLAGIVQGLLQEFSLSSEEGVALMCLAEALLRIPDAATRNALIRDKIGSGNWQPHRGHSPSVFVNAATWGLWLTGKLVAPLNEAELSLSLGRVLARCSEGMIRKAVDMAMRMMGQQFVTGQTIAQALVNARKLEAQGFRYSYDMLGEAALTAADAARYLASYEQAIHAIGKVASGAGIYEGPGISVKLSALHPRYCRAQHERVMAELYPVLLRLGTLAKHYDIGLNIDAEEADRLELSLELLERLCHEPALTGWNGIGFVIQAYQKRCPYVIDHLLDLAHRSNRRLMVRLVKGAYWDSEIKRAQVDGLAGYPVYTRKPHTDVSYLACARKLLADPVAVYPQFATHNAHTLAAIYHLAGSKHVSGQYEFQCLHGMGEGLYEQVVGSAVDGKLERPCRIYAPVGTHETLLAYLVRRLLENGANTSFVNHIADPSVSIEQLVQDPVEWVERTARQEGALGLPHPAIALPARLYGEGRSNSRGLDLADEQQLASLSQVIREGRDSVWLAGPMLASDVQPGMAQVVTNPADHRDQVGHVQEASDTDVSAALAAAQAHAIDWASTAPRERAAALDRAADQFEQDMPLLIGLLQREAGKTAANAIAEVREAVDFLRYYAAQVRDAFDNASHRPLGPVVCISPWNFPLAIFSGQIAAALAAGNTVLAKPAEQTPLIAAYAVHVLWQAGIPHAALQLLPGRGETVGAQLVGDPRVMGVMFTGSTEVARLLQRNIAGRLDAYGRPITLIAETGGQNAMIVDSSALVEQVVGDVIASAFDSAGQRCSALRVLCLQEEAAGRIIEMLKGAMGESRIGNPRQLAVDVGPVIDAEAKIAIEQHIESMRARGRRIHQQARQDSADALEHGTFVLPTLIELDSIDELQREIFGPVLHIVRYRRQDLNALLDRINTLGYGLTLGLHTRIEETITQVMSRSKVGNTYVNRNMVGAVVGVQPFGGEGLSGTGPKAGGPLYLYRLLARCPDHAPRSAVLAETDVVPSPATDVLDALKQWAIAEGHATLEANCDRFRAQSPSGLSGPLRGPTGERNLYSTLPRERVLCLAADQDDLLIQLSAICAVGSRALWPAECASLHQRLPPTVRERVALVEDWRDPSVSFDAVLHHGDRDSLQATCLRIAERPGPIVGITGVDHGDPDVPLERLVCERALSVNTTAAGGNTSLMCLT
jgi:RHH-type proline utilization regulon transcriptional repressor/proline dehydrogenase/delta 1-pyrroline-5-carboxylate dehydrogenase